MWQVTWTKHGLPSSGEDRDEVLVSVSAEGRISKWLLCSGGLDCTGTTLTLTLYLTLTLTLLCSGGLDCTGTVLVRG